MTGEAQVTGTGGEGVIAGQEGVAREKRQSASGGQDCV